VNQTIIFCQYREITLAEYALLFNVEKMIAKEVDGSEIRDLLWSAFSDGARYKKQAFDKSPADVGDWIDEDKTGAVEKAFSAMIERVKGDLEDEAKKK